MPRKRDGKEPPTKQRDKAIRPLHLVKTEAATDFREWWLKDGVQLPTFRAYRDVSLQAMRHLMQRLVHKATPNDVKDVIALALVPKLSAEFRGRFNEDGGGSDGEGGPMDEMLTDYGIKMGR